MKRRLRPGEDTIARHIHANIRRGVEQVTFHLPQGTPVALCAGGPSLGSHLEDVRRLQMEGAEVVCVGNSAHTLNAAGVKVNGHIIMDGVERNRTFVIPDQDTRYFVASQCDPSVFRALEHHRHVYIWHAGGPPAAHQILNDWYGPGGYWLVPGGSYISLRAISLLHMLGYTWLHVFGLDSCLMEPAADADNEHHAYSQPNADGQQVVEGVTVGDRDFRCTAWMLDQADQFIDCAQRGYFGSAQLAIHGDGLIAHMLKSGHGPTWRLA